MWNVQTRRILFWVTVAVVILVLVSGIVAVVRLLVRPREAPLTLTVLPAEVTLCQHEQVLFAVDPPLADVEWAITGGGEIGVDGRYTAGELPGDYEVQAAGPGGELGRAVVHIQVCTPTPTPVPTPTPEPSPTPTPEPIPIQNADAQGDVGLYSTGTPVEQPPAGLDIRNASIEADGRVVLGGIQYLPAELAAWMESGETVLWVSLYEPLPDTLDAYTEWLFVLDMDGDTGTGRQMGSAAINPDLGDEAALALFYDPNTAAFGTYSLIWDPAAGGWAAGLDLRYWISEDRTLLALGVPLNSLQQQVAQTAGVATVPEATRGRAAAVAYTEPERLIDFYPDLP